MFFQKRAATGNIYTYHVDIVIRPVKGLNFQWRIKKKNKKKNHLKSDCGIEFGGFERFPFF